MYRIVTEDGREGWFCGRDHHLLDAMIAELFGDRAGVTVTEVDAEPAP